MREGTAESVLAQSMCRESTALIRQRALDEARTLLTKSIEIDPQCSDAYNNLGIISCQQGRGEEAIEYFLETERHDPQESYVRNRIDVFQ